MRILIFEGIATSGKSTLMLALSANPTIANKTVVFEEKGTHIPIMKQTSDLHLDFYRELINRAISQSRGIVIFDRLYLTQAFRAKASLDDYSEIEEMLLPYSPITIFLKVDESVLMDRITKAMEHRDPKWAKYLNGKGETPKEIARYYIDQQNSQLNLLKQSKIPYKIFETTDHNYKDIKDRILKEVINI
jgi:thymidylate kinase